MQILQGFRTITFNIVAITASWLTTKYGISLTEEHQTAISVTLVSLANIALRIFTKTPVNKKR